jgi:hypothetical protein
MEKIEADIIEVLKKASKYNSLVDLIIASRIVGSDQLYQNGIQRLISSKSSPELEQSKRMGLEAAHVVMTAVIDALRRTHAVEVSRLKSEMDQAAASACSCSPLPANNGRSSGQRLVDFFIRPVPLARA